MRNPRGRKLEQDPSYFPYASRHRASHAAYLLFRLVKANEEFIELVKIRGEWVSRYRFGLSEHLSPDYEVTNWYLSHHSDSHFLTGLLAARPAPDRRYALLYNQLTVHHLNG
ncbi:MAG: arylamine N-acetyltransferase, partial [Nitrospirales bacterium]|nr:arylamine N-acetyltransferase [Nitrospirales bacterium]